MRNTTKTILLVALFAFSANTSNAQNIKAFTPDSIKFLQEVSKMFLDVDKKRYKDYVEEFTAVWYSGKISEARRLEVYKTSNAMLDKRMRTPEFEPYFYSLMSFVRSDLSDESFTSWQESLEKLLDAKNKRRYIDYVKMSANLFSDNIIFQSTSTVWKSSNNNYKFVYDSLPKIVFPSLNLICFSKKDSSVIYDTKGVFYPTLDRFDGDGGKATWERVGLDPTKTYAVFEEYSLRIKSAGFSIENVLFFNDFFSQPLKGKLIEKILSKSGEDASYPRFESYDKRLSIPNIVENVDYDGGFTMQGAKLQGSGSKEEPAQLIFYRENEPFLVTKSLHYTIKPEKISSARISCTFYLGDDSISHPGLTMKFMKEARLLTLLRDNEISKSPYFNSFHNVDMFFEALYWKIDDPMIEMGALFGSTDTKATFESVNYYQQTRYDRLQGMDQVHPLIRLKDVSRNLNSDAFTAMDVAKEMRITMPQVIPLLIELSSQGFISYDTETEVILMKDKAKEYILARAGKIDYDVITFRSEVSNKSNAVLNLLNYDLLIRGVQRVTLSDSQQVIAFPAGGEVNVKKNRDFDFKGALVAGRTTFFGKEFGFLYNEFQIDLINVDSMQMRAESFDKNNVDENGDPVLFKVKSVLQGIRGEIAIDNPFNKSGIQDEYPQYPILTSTKKSYVFYDSPKIYDGVYNRDNFYFQIDPFVLDSLDNYPNESVDFKGTFVSAGIFPDFQDALTIQPDYSLGFVRGTPSGGFGTYAGDAVKYNNEIRLSNQGLKGSGVINFVHSTSESDEFTFFPDSIQGYGKFVNIETEGPPEFPAVHSDSLLIRYFPQVKALIAKKVDKDIRFFRDEAFLDGIIVLKEDGMIGRGEIKFENASLYSSRFQFGTRTIDSDSADFSMPSMEAENVTAHVDFVKRKGEFTANGENDPMQFKEVKYICYMDKFDWYMDEEKMTFSNSGAKEANSDLSISSDLDMNVSNFYSVHPDQDSLNFTAPEATYYLKKQEVRCEMVEWIKVADARIRPDSGKVVIHKNAKMETLKNASIEANFVTKYHTMYNGLINIYAKNNYAGSADYDYIDENKATQTIHFETVSIDTTFQTYAAGKVLEDDKFTLSPSFAYKGKVSLLAANKNLNFDGSTQIFHDCAKLSKGWMAFKADIDPNDIYIPVAAELKSERGEAVGAGVIINQDSISLYSTFLSVKKSASHPALLAAEGFLFFDKKSQQYQISNKEKLKERSLPGNFVSLSVSSCEVSGSGQFDFGTSLGLIKLKPIGEIKHDVSQDEVSINSSMAISFPFSDQAMDRMADYIEKYPDLDPIDFEKSTYEQSLRELVGTAQADKLYGELSLNGTIKKMPDELQSTLFLADVKFKWNKESKAYESVGKIGLGNIGKNQVFKYVNGKIQIKKQRASKGDVLTVYLELDANNWFFFTYTRGLMQSISSDIDFNTIIKETKDDKRKFKEEKELFQYMLSTTRKKVDYLKQFDSL